LASKEEAANLIPRNEIQLTGNFGDSPLGFSALVVKPGSIRLVGTNRAFGASEPRGVEFFKDASSLAGRYVSLTNVTFVGAKFDGSGKARVKGGGGEVNVVLTQTLKDRDVPQNPFNALGVPIKVEGGWALLAARFLPVAGRNATALAAKHTCLACHNPDTKAIGPAYREVAARYRNDPEVVSKLTLQMEKGGVGKWGQVLMPPLGAKVPPEDRKLLAEWIVGYSWDALLAE
jgi:cytochrome c